MSAQIFVDLKAIFTSRALGLGLIVILIVIGITSLVWIQMDQVIAPPKLRILDWLWKVFVCRCNV